MGLILLFCAIAIAGIVSLVKNGDGDAIILFGGACGLVICFTLFLVFAGKADEQIQEYSRDKAQIELTYRNIALTGEERTAAITIAVNYNKVIQKHQKWNKDLFVGIFYSKKVASLPLFDLAKISPANSFITVNKE